MAKKSKRKRTTAKNVLKNKLAAESTTAKSRTAKSTTAESKPTKPSKVKSSKVEPSAVDSSAAHQSKKVHTKPSAAESDSRAGKIGWTSALLLLVFLLGCFKLSNYDIWWHLKTGELILQNGKVPYTDWYTYTNPDAEWIDLHWGFQIVAALLFKIGGSAALVVFKSLVATITFAVCLSITKRNWPIWQTVVIWLGPILIFAGRYYVRPEILSLCFFACTLGILHHSIKNARWLWLLPILQVFWVNVQGLFVLQFVVMACFLVDQLGLRFFSMATSKPDIGNVVDHEISCSSRGLVDLKKFAISLALTLVASLINPYGFRGATFPLVLFQKVRGQEREFFYQFASELEGIDTILERSGLALLTDLTPLLMLLMTVAIAISFFALFFMGKGINVYRLLLFLGFAYLTWNMSRNSTFYAIAGGMILRMNFGEIAEMLYTGAQSFRIPKILLAACLGTLIISIPTNIYSHFRRSFVPRTFGFGQADWYPQRACEFINSNADKMPDNVYAWHIGCAAKVIYHVAPKKKVFVDARLETNKKETLAAYLKVVDFLGTANPNTDRLLTFNATKSPIDRAELPALLFDVPTLVQSTMQGSQLSQNLVEGKQWRCVYFDTTGAVFVSEEFAKQNQLPKADTGYLDNFIKLRKFGTLQIQR